MSETTFEKNLKDYECTGPSCQHEIAEDHYTFTREALISLFKSMVEEVEPMGFKIDEEDLDYPNYDLGWKEGQNEAIKKFKSNLLKALGEEK